MANTPDGRCDVKRFTKADCLDDFIEADLKELGYGT